MTVPEPRYQEYPNLEVLDPGPALPRTDADDQSITAAAVEMLR